MSELATTDPLTIKAESGEVTFLLDRGNSNGSFYLVNPTSGWGANPYFHVKGTQSGAVNSTFLWLEADFTGANVSTLLKGSVIPGAANSLIDLSVSGTTVFLVGDGGGTALGNPTTAGILNVGPINLSAGSWASLGIGLKFAPATYTLTTTIHANQVIHSLQQATVASSSSYTADWLAALYCEAPVAGSNVTATLRYTGYFDGGNGVLIQSDAAGAVANVSAEIRLQRNDGVIAADDYLGSILFTGSDGGTDTVDASVFVRGFANETFSSTEKGGYGILGAKANGTDYNAAGTNVLRWDTNGAYLLTGNLGVGETSPDYKLDVNGAIGFTPGSSVTPIDNGDVVFEFTNNTTLTFKGKGSDGTVRSATLTLS